MHRKWNEVSIGTEIINMYESGESLNYSSVASTNLSLLRAATRYYGTWEAAVTAAGLDYSTIRKTKAWSRDLIISRIKELHSEGADLSWANFSRNVDPQLAAAATSSCYFSSWREAVEAAGLDYDAIRRYREWNDQRIVKMLRDFHASGADLNAKNMLQEDVTLITAARRHFESWHLALTAAGLDYRRIVRRAPFKRGLGRGQYKMRARTYQVTATAS